MYLAIDPGKTTGYALFDENGKPTEFKAIKGEDAFLDWLEEQPLNKDWVVIIETYRNRGGSHDHWSQNPTSQHIGAIKRILRKKHVTRLVEQEPSPCLNFGLRFLGLATTYKGKHVPDEVSALAHGTYYLRKNRLEK